MSQRAPLIAALVAVGAALAVSGVWYGRLRAPVAESALESTVALRVTRHDSNGVPREPVAVREPARVRAVVEALGIDTHPAVPCPPDYATAEVGLLLTGRDVYARRNVYVWDLSSDTPRVIVSSSSGCRGGAPANTAVLQRELIR